MDKSPEVIRQEMEQTRSTMQEKLEILEEQVKSTVQEAAQAVNSVTETVAGVKESVQQTVTGVQETVSSVTDKIEQTAETVVGGVENVVESAKQTFDIPLQVRQHPWPMFVGATAVGFIAGKLLEQAMPSSMSMPRLASAAAPAMAGTPTQERQGRHSNGHGSRHAKSAAPAKSGFNLWNMIVSNYGDELNKLKSLGVAMLGGVVREMVISSTPPAMADRVKEVIDGVTHKLGAEPLKGPIFTQEKERSTQEDEQGPAGKRNVPMRQW